MTTDSSSRRRFLVAGGASVLGAATLAACSNDATVTPSGTVASTSVPPTAPPAKPTKKELEAARSALRTATSIELSIAAFYDDFVAAPYLDEEARGWGTRFRQYHEAGAEKLAELTRTAGGKPYTEPNEVLDNGLIKRRMTLANSTKSSTRLIRLATTLEQTAASHETQVVSSLTSPELRAGIMEVGGANARRVVFWRLLSDPGDFAAALPEALFTLRDALGAEAVVDS